MSEGFGMGGRGGYTTGLPPLGQPSPPLTPSQPQLRDASMCAGRESTTLTPTIAPAVLFTVPLIVCSILVV